MTRLVFAFLLMMVFRGQMTAQSTAYVFKGGPSLANQKWDNSLNRQFLLRYHAALALESINNDDDRFSLYGQFGYHVRGSAIRFRTFNINSGVLGNLFTQPFEFNNLSLQLGAKFRKPMASRDNNFFYFGGLRGDYNLNDNLAELQNIFVCNRGSLPLVGGTQKWLFGLSLGGGIEFKFSELTGGQIELSFHPDITPQYRQGPIPNVIDQCAGTTYTIPERRIRNTTIELSFGLRLLRKVVYLEE
ncbi:MAG: hypothetical protein KF734_11725 [Saprospiraceae bacterium]|nr:hypothetical protein [Saprospiraceae bacterium]